MSASAVAAPALPEPGQVVEVRGSTWAVANVQAQGLPRSPADESVAQLTHVVDLQSLDEDRLGEQLSVVWELENTMPMPRRVGRPMSHVQPSACAVEMVADASGASGSACATWTAKALSLKSTSFWERQPTP